MWSSSYPCQQTPRRQTSASESWAGPCASVPSSPSWRQSWGVRSPCRTAGGRSRTWRRTGAAPSSPWRRSRRAPGRRSSPRPRRCSGAPAEAAAAAVGRRSPGGTAVRRGMARATATGTATSTGSREAMVMPTTRGTRTGPLTSGTASTPSSTRPAGRSAPSGSAPSRRGSATGWGRRRTAAWGRPSRRWPGCSAPRACAGWTTPPCTSTSGATPAGASPWRSATPGGPPPAASTWSGGLPTRACRRSTTGPGGTHGMSRASGAIAGRR
mmetsp:Transcript_65604/g.195272  ORF Transcript_65604/g.195272 Transcript_65604/m.195272 type:complete len:269 (-) Transcript_65604:386-1192(-)